jgi:putative glutamine amidotransferase
VNSSHHQALERLATGIEVEAWSSSDGIVEQARLGGYDFAVGVQYHPERHPLYLSLFADFFDRVRDAR